MSAPPLDHFLSDTDTILSRISDVDPRAYDRTRNYLNGSVTWLSPFLTHGIIDTTDVAEGMLLNHPVKSCYRLMFELAWREFFHRTWQLHGDEIFEDMKQSQAGAEFNQLPTAIQTGTTGIEAIDECIHTLLNEGTLHNHARMWIAGITCNMARTWWPEPARWLHYHLLDGDIASNTLSWQWIAGTFSHKQYFANQDNVDKFSKRRQPQSWLDVPYEAFDDFAIPDVLRERQPLELENTLPGKPMESVQGHVALRSLWDLNPRWQPDAEHHFCFVDTDHAKQWPMSPIRWRFIEHWVNQCGATLVHGTEQQMHSALKDATVHRREYPGCANWPGTPIERRWLYQLPQTPFPSFSKFWKSARLDVGL